MNNPGLKDLETKEKSLLDEFKPFVEDDQADYVVKFYMVDNRILDTPLYELQAKLEKLIGEIYSIEQEIKGAQVNHVNDEYKSDLPYLKNDNKDLDGLKKWLELKKITKKKYERALGIGSSTK
jgi:hypothetical protein